MPLCVLIAACGNPNQRLDEYVFYDGPRLKLKVVRYYRNIPFNYLGEYAVVMCQSENTLNFAAHDQQDAGWRMLGAGGGQDSTSAEQAAVSVKDDYEVLGGHTLVAKTNIFNISFDACGHFINWDPSRLPQTMIDPVDKPDSCAPNGPADCRYYAFEGDRAPQYEQISVSGKGQVSFTARSKAFKDIELLRVETVNNGAVWHVLAAGFDADKQRLQPESIRSLSMPLLEKGTADVSLMKWFESTLPPRSMVIWPDALGPCGEQPATDEQTFSMPCAEIHFNEIEGNSGVVYIVMNTASTSRPVEASFHSGVYLSGDIPHPVTSLTALGENLAARTR